MFHKIFLTPHFKKMAHRKLVNEEARPQVKHMWPDKWRFSRCRIFVYCPFPVSRFRFFFVPF